MAGGGGGCFGEKLGWAGVGGSERAHLVAETQLVVAVGLGLNLVGMKFILAKPIDKNTNDWQFVFELGSFLNRIYNLPY